jgi:hypothetical protein
MANNSRHRFDIDVIEKETFEIDLTDKEVFEIQMIQIDRISGVDELQTLKDTEFSSLAEGESVVWDGEKFVNKKIMKFDPDLFSFLVDE